MQIDRHYGGTEFITGLRAIAVFLVFLIHSGGGGLREVSEFLNTFVDFGKYGVQIFFVISGFTIFYQLYEGQYSLRRFLFIRISRISIPYFPILLLIFVYINLGGEQFNNWADKFNDGKVTIENIIFHITYLASFDLKYANTIIGVEWTLNIEVFFYCVIGFLLTRGFLKRTLVNVSFWFLFFCGVAIIFLILGYTNTLDRLLIHWMPFHYGWMFILGGAAYLIRKKLVFGLSSDTANKISDLCVLISLFIIIILVSINTLGLINEIVFSLITAVLIITTRDSAKLSRLLTNKAMLHFGSISFSFYLIHYIVILFQIPFLIFEVESQIAIFIFNLLLTTLVSLFWYVIFEKILYKKAKSAINKRFYAN